MQCGAAIHAHTGDAITQSAAVWVSVAVIQRRNPQKWPKNGIHPKHKEYEELYDVLLVRDQASGLYQLPHVAAETDTDPATTAVTAWDDIKVTCRVCVCARVLSDGVRPPPAEGTCVARTRSPSF